MYYTVKRGDFTAQIDSMGAQLHSLKRTSDGTEYLWQGDTSIWYGQAPVLFPVIGQLLEGKYRYAGTEYEMPKHGFSRHMPFQVASAEESEIVFVLSSNDETRKIYPFEFDFFVIYKIMDDGLSCTHRVVNKTDGEMWFSCGAHPGFNCKIGDKLVFSENETLSSRRIDSDSILTEELVPVLDSSAEIRLTPTLFANDALILENVRSSSVDLVAESGERVLTFFLPDSPWLGIWAKPNAPFVCIEPWYGVNDDRVKKDDLSKKQSVQRLGRGEEFAFTWRVSCA